MNRIPLEIINDDTEIQCVLKHKYYERIGISLDIYVDNLSESQKQQLMKYPKAIYKIKDQYYSGILPIIGKIKSISKGNYFIVPSTFDPIETGYTIHIYSSKEIKSENLQLQLPDVYKDLYEIDEELLLKTNIQYYSNIHIEDLNIIPEYKFNDLKYIQSSLYSALSHSIKLQQRINDLEKKLNITNTENNALKPERKNEYHKSFRK